MRVKNPKGAEQSFTPERNAAGRYHVAVMAALPGHYHWRWEGGGIDEGWFE